MSLKRTNLHHRPFCGPGRSMTVDFWTFNRMQRSCVDRQARQLQEGNDVDRGRARVTIAAGENMVIGFVWLLVPWCRQTLSLGRLLRLMPSEDPIGRRSPSLPFGHLDTHWTSHFSFPKDGNYDKKHATAHAAQVAVADRSHFLLSASGQHYYPANQQVLAVESPSPRGWVCIGRVLNEVSVALLLRADAGDSNKMAHIQPYEDNHRLLCDCRKWPVQQIKARGHHV